MDVDLHCHSTRSDGLLAPRQLVARAAQRRIRVLALTDHDETGGLAEARACAAELGIVFINGVEISVTWQGQTIHVVGLLASAGSDFHGPGESYRDLGDFPELPGGCTPVWANW